ncbi:MAG: DUF2094 domain-containing protein [Desulfobacula sp.]|nr:DUF2094 domain-containing protein [Desulfobacula sp.]
MLGINTNSKEWQWSVYGKHPSFNDFLDYQTDNTLLHDLAMWVESGSKLLKKKNNLIYSYRFWVRGIKKNDLICGIIKNSSDSIGRHYPLFITGHGTILGWAKDWDIVFMVFDSILRIFENLSAKRFNNFNDFKLNLYNTRFNSLQWENVKSIMTNSHKLDTLDILPGYYEINQIKNSNKPAKAEINIPINKNNPPGFLDTETGLLKKMFKKSVPVPDCVFIGGQPEQPVLKIFNRPLVPNDLMNLF